MKQAATASPATVLPRLNSKTEAIWRLRESALELFASRGFEGTSLRDVAAQADVPLSTINRYFGSKIDLFNELEMHIWREVNRDRDDLLRHSIMIADAGRPTLETVLYAFVYPIVRRACGDSNRSEALGLRLLREYAAMRVHSGLQNSFADVAKRWVQEIVTARPGLSRHRAIWALAFTINTTFSDQLQHGWYNELMPIDANLSAADITRMIVAFCSSGIEAIADLPDNCV